MTRIAIVDNNKLKDMDRKKYIQSLCPVNRVGKDCIYFEGPKLLISEKLCIGCSICHNAEPEAIKIINLPEALNQNPIHQYSQNGFRLYSLPTPKFGQVVGIAGVNGIGKSTAIKILAGALTPNLGELGKNAGYDELLQYFKGTEAQTFFEHIRDGKIKAAYKPQAVDLIPKTQSGKVIELLEKVDERGELAKIAKELQLDKILDSDITKISGGELQRVAIAATVLKQANFYIFDEPTSYLDIKQRFKISKYIRSLSNTDTAIMVIEHDLIILDYMTDLIHIMYGKEGGYGIVSGTKTTKTGINVYLQGYLKEENVRFRDHEIKFLVRPPEALKHNEIIAEWTNIEKKLGRFRLHTENGKIEKKKVIGILGENGIGKTTFVKILAGIEKPDSGDTSKQIIVSYKPQYLESNSNELVITFLQEAIKTYETQLVHPLNLKPLFLKKLSELSGGELQRVSIGFALSQDADLFLLDEPSAYLDIEQRLRLSKIIRDFMDSTGKTALVVDHDLLFLDYISDNLIVFDGEPAIKGLVTGPFSMQEGMNKFLKDMQLTFRRDEESYRPRANKPDSQMDQKQIREGKLYYS